MNLLKKVGVASFIIVWSLVGNLASAFPAQAATDFKFIADSDRYVSSMAQSGSVFAWVDWGNLKDKSDSWGKVRVIYIYNAETGTTEKIPGYFPTYLTVFSDSVYWDNKTDASVYSYDFATKKITQQYSLAQIDPLLKSGQFEFGSAQVASKNFITYAIKLINPKPGTGSVGSVQYYDATANKVIGLYKINDDGSGYSMFSTYQSSLMLSPSEQSDNNIKSMWDYFNPSVVNNDYLFGFNTVHQSDKHGSPYTSEYRVKNLQSGTVSTHQYPSKESFIVVPEQGTPTMWNMNITANSDYIIVNQYADNPQFAEFRRFNYKTGELGPVFLTASRWDDKKSTVTLGQSNQGILWIDRSTNEKKYFWYDVGADTKCQINPFSTDVTRRAAISDKYVFWREENNAWYARKLVCGVSATTDTKTVTPITISDPIITTPSIAPTTPVIATGKLIKSKSTSSVYFVGNDGKRYVFYNGDIYKTWYSNFSGVKTLTPKEVGAIPMGGNVTYRPGTLVKTELGSGVYVVDKGGVLRGLASEAAAKGLYGAQWTKQIKTIPDFLFVNYSQGDIIHSADDINLQNVKNSAPDINVDKGL